MDRWSGTDPGSRNARWSGRRAERHAGLRRRRPRRGPAAAGGVALPARRRRRRDRGRRGVLGRMDPRRADPRPERIGRRPAAGAAAGPGLDTALRHRGGGVRGRMVRAAENGVAMTADRVTEGRRLGLWARLKRVALTDVGALVRGFKAADIEAMERLLLEADFGIGATTDLVEMLEEGVRRGRLKTEDDLRGALVERLTSLLEAPRDPGRLTREGERWLLAAADPYRAGAVAQLEIWAERLGLPCVSGAAGGDPAAVAFDAVLAATARGSTVAIIDTAGRLHTQEGLMEELRKIVRVIGRKAPGAPQESLLVLDGTVGQNAVQQGKLFAQAVAPTGLVITKLDGPAKGGAVVALRRELALPIRFLGTGEQADDLQVFDPVRYAADLLADGPEATTGDR